MTLPSLLDLVFAVAVAVAALVGAAGWWATRRPNAQLPPPRPRFITGCFGPPASFPPARAPAHSTVSRTGKPMTGPAIPFERYPTQSVPSGIPPPLLPPPSPLSVALGSLAGLGLGVLVAEAVILSLPAAGPGLSQSALDQLNLWTPLWPLALGALADWRC